MARIDIYPQTTSQPNEARLVTGSEYLTASKVALDVTPVLFSQQDLTFQVGLSMSANVESNVWDVTGFSSGSFQVIWSSATASGTLNATMILEGSVDQSNWSDIGGNFGGTIIRSLTDDDQIWEFTSLPIPYIRLAYTSNNFTGGTITIKVSGK
ncbi:hypothetical protein GOV11_04180 [Candidatus Woesearchaeota archaeon]|nr:hypothetical protein [Candidatus Woesearchaeota archaeon]